MSKLMILIFLVVSISFGQENLNCTSSDCHDNYSNYDSPHPVIDDCSICHEQINNIHNYDDNPDFQLKTNLPDLCYECHADYSESKFIHSAVMVGECLGCHNPHGSNTVSLLKNEEPGELCVECHGIENYQDVSMHGPVISLQCLTCHQPHASEKAALLSTEPPELCYFCHVDKKELLNASNVHPAYLETCVDCHSPHKSQNNFLMLQPLPDLCVTCHSDIIIDPDKAKTVHAALINDRSCVACHSAHATEISSLLWKDAKNLCLSCHNKTYEDGKTKIKNIAKIIDKAEYDHVPVSESTCIDCHGPHFSEYGFLLNDTFPTGSYSATPAVKEFQLCFDCHEKNNLEEQYTTDVTNFRDGKVNLHYLHILKNKGRNCITCHETHGSLKPHLIAEKVEFGNWAMPIKYEQTPEGGVCTPGCHRTLPYNPNKEE